MGTEEAVVPTGQGDDGGVASQSELDALLVLMLDAAAVTSEPAGDRGLLASSGSIQLLRPSPKNPRRRPSSSAMRTRRLLLLLLLWSKRTAGSSGVWFCSSIAPLLISRTSS